MFMNNPEVERCLVDVCLAMVTFRVHDIPNLLTLTLTLTLAKMTYLLSLDSS